MSQTSLPKLDNKTRTLRNIENLHINRLKDYFLDTMEQHREALCTYHKQCKQWLIDQLEVYKTHLEIEDIFYENNSIFSTIEVGIFDFSTILNSILDNHWTTIK